MNLSSKRIQTTGKFWQGIFGDFGVSCGVAFVLAAASGLWSPAASADSSDWEPAGELVDSSAESLLALEGSVLPSDLSYDGVREFLTCFAGHMDLPPQVYLDCGLAVARASVRCSGKGLDFQCLSSLIAVAQKCAAPVSQAIQSAQQCLSADQDGGELLLNSDW